MTQNKNTFEQPYQITTAQRLAAGALAGSLLTGVAIAPTEFSAPEAHTQKVTQPDLNLSAASSQVNIDSPAPKNVSPTDFSPNGFFTTHVSATASGAETTPNTPSLPEPPILERNNLIKLDTNNLVVSKEIEKSLSENVVYVPEIGCSGYLIRELSTKQPIGLEIADHCSFEGTNHFDNSLNRLKDEKGNNYINFKKPLQVQTGDKLDQMKTINYIDRVMAPAQNDKKLDLVIAAFKGHSPQEVLDAYKNSALTEEELENINNNDKIIISGWPVKQTNKDGQMHRQSFALNVLGRGVANTTGGKAINVLWTAVKKNKAGAVCSFGASGAEGRVFTEVGSKVDGKSAWTLVAFDDLIGDVNGTKEQAAQTKAYWENQFGIDLSPYGAVCAFGNKTPDANNSAAIIKLILSIEQIPGHGRKALLERARKEILNPKAKRTIVDGYYAYSPPETAKGGKFKWIYRPGVSVDTVTGSVVVSWNEPGKPSNLHQEYIDNSEFLTFYKGRPTDADPKLVVSKTAVRSVTNGKVPYFKDRSGITFGVEQPETFDPYYLKSYYLKIAGSSKGSNFTIAERKALKGGGF